MNVALGSSCRRRSEIATALCSSVDIHTRTNEMVLDLEGFTTKEQNGPLIQIRPLTSYDTVFVTPTSGSLCVVHNCGYGSDYLSRGIM